MTIIDVRSVKDGGVI